MIDLRPKRKRAVNWYFTIFNEKSGKPKISPVQSRFWIATELNSLVAVAGSTVLSLCPYLPGRSVYLSR